jgi:hypothetical protein
MKFLSGWRHVAQPGAADHTCAELDGALSANRRPDAATSDVGLPGNPSITCRVIDLA